jgi:hypothetical protein
MELKQFEERRAMREFAEENLSELCAELAEWQDTGILREGKMRELAGICTYMQCDQLQQAERLVEHTAIRRLAGANA